MKSILYNKDMINKNFNTELDPLAKELQDYTNKLNFLRTETARIEGVVLYIQNQIDQKANK
jgi:pantothenate kinase